MPTRTQRPTATPRGDLIDIGGRRLRLVRAGARGKRPTILLESGAFGCAADWGVVQARLAARGLYSLAYDRAGLGLSDPGARPRDGAAITADLRALLSEAGELGPYVLVGHSMGGLFVRLFALDRPEQVTGVVLVDAVTPEITDDPAMGRAVEGFRRAMGLVGASCGVGYMRPLSLVMGDRIGLPGAISTEKARIWGSRGHTRWSVEEVQSWHASALQARAAGEFAADLPVAVVTAGAARLTPRLKAVQSAPALSSVHGYVDHVVGSNHANLLGLKFADPIVRGVEHVLAVAAR